MGSARLCAAVEDGFELGLTSEAPIATQGQAMIRFLGNKRKKLL